MSQIKIAFIKKNESFIPSHVSEIKGGDVYYLVTDGKPSKNFTATRDAFLDAQENWEVSGTPAE